jgi:hypothetical protein
MITCLNCDTWGDLEALNVSFNWFSALVLNVESGRLGCFEWWWLGVIYSSNHYSSCWVLIFVDGTPDSPVRTEHDTVQCPVPATSVTRWSWTLDSPAPVAHRTVRCDLTTLTVSKLLYVSNGDSHSGSWPFTKSTVARGLTGQSGDTPDSPVNFSRGALRFPESDLFVRCDNLSTRPVTGQSGAPHAGASLTCTFL